MKGKKNHAGTRHPKSGKNHRTVNPPQIEDQLSVGKTLRFVTTGIGGAAQASISYQNLLDAWLIAGTAVNAYQLFDFVRIKRVTVRAIPFSVSGANAAFQASVTVGIEFPGLVAGQGGAGNQASDTALGIDRCAVVSLCPGDMSPASFWQSSTGNNAFVVRATNADGTVALGAVIDVELSYKNSADVAPAAVASAVVGAVPGDLYFGGLDGGRLAATWARSAFVRRI